MKLAHVCYNSNETIEYLNSQTPDVIFLDIQIPGMTGVELAHVISTKTQLVFTTAFSDYAAKSYELNAVDYLVKPILFERFLQAIVKVDEKASDRHTKEFVVSEDDFVFFKTGKRLVKVALSAVMFFESQKEYIRVKTTNEEFLIYKRMKDIVHDLPRNFHRIHHSYVVNLRHVERIEDNHVSIGKKLGAGAEGI